MGYNRDNYRLVRREYDGKNLKAKEEAEARREELHRKIPELCDLDSALSLTGLSLMAAASALSGDALEAKIAQIRTENEKLQAARKKILAEHGYPPDYSSVRYECPDCMDTGYRNGKMCACMRRRLTLLGYESSGIGYLIRTQSFATFDPEYQRGNPRAYENCSRNLAKCREYAENFSAGESRNLLLLGATGLGKTHLSTAVAKTVIDRGFDVVYATSADFFSDFERERFANDAAGNTRRYFDCDLLILDDLGTEVTNPFTLSCLYNIVNSRLNHAGSTIMNTNLTQEELRRRYTDRIVSRLFGEYAPLVFTGSDVRQKKLTQN